MKTGILSLCALLPLVACSPQVYSSLYNVKYPSPSTVDLEGKTMSLVYLSDESKEDSLFNSFVADGLAQGLEAEFFDGQKAIEVYSLPKEEKVDYSQRDTMISMLLGLGTDVLMLVDTPQSGKNNENQNTYLSNLYVYDSMGKDEVVPLFRHTSSKDSSLLMSDAQYIGYEFSKTFINEWKKEYYSLLYFDGVNGDWLTALAYVDAAEWALAMDIWMQLVKDDNPVKQSCAAYNLAVGCHMIGEYEVALEWLDISDKTYPVSNSSSLRSKIQKAAGL